MTRSTVVSCGADPPVACPCTQIATDIAYKLPHVAPEQLQALVGEVRKGQRHLARGRRRARQLPLRLHPRAQWPTPHGQHLGEAWGCGQGA